VFGGDLPNGYDTVLPPEKRNASVPQRLPRRAALRRTGRRISTSTTQYKIGGSTDVRLDGKGRCDYRREQRYGLATAQRFAQEGAYVFITGRRQSELDKAKP